ncbi:CDP-glycerol glycerophosphotransferase family protein [Bacteroides fragilis]|nr:CDP-glycerol glycerophosphotransferase family protein [Bacteroides fragilis]MCY6340347.1 CDP-glycerol glycerophosphotransferase family protein [Bacteroides fragilis]
MINNTLMKLSFSSFIASTGILFSRIIKRDSVMLFSSFPDYTDNAYALFQYISGSKQYDHYLKVWVLSDKTGYKACKKDILSKNSNTKVVFRFSLLAFWYFFRAKFVFCTHGLYSFWDISQRDKLINLWHGMPLKRIGSMDPAKHGVNKTKAHYLIATSEIFRELMSKSFNNLDLSRVLLVGQPRNDLLFQKTDFFSKRNIQRTDYCSVGIWLPTFRTSIIGETRTDGISTNDTISFLNIADLQDLNIFLSEIKILLIVKLHPMDILQTVDFPLFTNIMIVKQNDFSFQLYPLLGATDFLLTDYSSVWIDYDILDRPMGFVMNDIDEYQKSRGLTFDNISEVLPGPILSDLESLKSFLKTPETYKKETQNKFNLYKDDQACYRLMHVIDKLNKNGLIFRYMITVYVIGVFDLFHRGHVELLKKAKGLGDRLVVAINSDEMVANYKRKPVINENDRLAVVKACSYVDEAFIIPDLDNKLYVIKYNVDIIVHGDDWTGEGYLNQICMTPEFLQKHQIELVYLPYTKGISTSKIIKSIQELNNVL